MKVFDNEWILEAFAGRSTFFTKRMFGGLAAYLHERMMLVLVEPTKTGRWTWHGVLVCTGFEHHASIGADFPALAPLLFPNLVLLAGIGLYVLGVNRAAAETPASGAPEAGKEPHAGPVST